MDEATPLPGLSAKITRLVQERGWNIEDFARQASLHRLTVRHILRGSNRKLHTETVRACARALGFSVLELQTEPLEKLLARNRGDTTTGRIHLERPMHVELRAWLERNPERAAGLSESELDELVALLDMNESVTTFAIAHAVERIERRRKIVQQVVAIAGTEYVELLEQLVTLLFEKIQPYPDRK